ncbi:hypothetical protein [Serratia symbiotica]
MYKLGRWIRQRPAEQRRRWRQRYAKPWPATFESWWQLKQQKTAFNA